MKIANLSYSLLIVFSFLIHAVTTAQVSINNQQLPPDPSAMLDMQSTKHGFLMPRMNQQARLGIAGPATGLMLYQQDARSGIYTNQGSAQQSAWTRITTTTPIFEARIPIDSVCPTCTDEGFEITEPGSYYLTRNIENHQSSSTPVIQISVPNVTLDLNGFTISHVVAAPNSYKNGIEVRTGSRRTNIVIKNGAIKDFANDGIDCEYSNNTTFQDLLITGSGHTGLNAGYYPTITNVISNNNELYGFNARDGALIQDCIANGNLSSGFYIRANSQVINCQAYENGQDGVRTSSSNCLIEGGSFCRNEQAGLYMSNRATVRGCVCSDNNVYGILVFSGLVKQCVANGNGGCVSSGTCVPDLGPNPTFTYGPAGTGICGRYNLVISDNYANDNLVGIFLSYTQGMVLNNYCEGNSHQGIVTMSWNSSVSTYSSFNMRNTCHNNGISANTSLTSLGVPAGEFFFSGTNASHGPIVDVSNTGDLLNKTKASHPAANFEY